MNIYSHLPYEYWDKYKAYIIPVGLCDDEKDVCTLEDFYNKLVEQNNETYRKFKINKKEPAKSLFLEFIERPSIKILDESYILRYMVMRIVTYFYYDYYENPRRINPMVMIFDEDANLHEQINPSIWRW